MLSRVLIVLGMSFLRCVSLRYMCNNSSGTWRIWAIPFDDRSNTCWFKFVWRWGFARVFTHVQVTAFSVLIISCVRCKSVTLHREGDSLSTLDCITTSSFCRILMFHGQVSYLIFTNVIQVISVIVVHLCGGVYLHIFKVKMSYVVILVVVFLS